MSPETVLGGDEETKFGDARYTVERSERGSLLPSNDREQEIKKGDLVRILPDWSSPAISIHAVYPTPRYAPSKLQIFVDALKAWNSPWWLPLG
jgi:DNA-binding transcriptional LysR family regulator